MDFRSYLTKHDGKPRPDGPELIRLAGSVGRSTYYLYLTALGHKRVSDKTALALHENSVGLELSVCGVNKTISPSR